MTHKDQGNQTPYALAEDHLWRDVIHASEVGSFVAGMTAYAAIYGKEPVGKTRWTTVFKSSFNSRFP